MKPRRPGDQAPPPRPAHRNDHLQTASTHQKDTAGKLYYVHDGSPERTVLELYGKRLDGLTYDEARRAKDQCVFRLKQRKASISEMTEQDSFVPADGSLPDPQLEQMRQTAVKAARPVAQNAQAKANAVQRAPGWEPAPKSKPATGKAAGWEPPPPGASSGNQASATAKTQKAAGWQKQEEGMQSAVKLDAPDGEEGSDELSDLMISPDLDTDMKAETERAMAAAKQIWDGLGEQRAFVKAQIERAAIFGEREKMYAAMDPAQVEEFETLETAHNMLFGPVPLSSPRAAPADQPPVNPEPAS